MIFNGGVFDGEIFAGVGSGGAILPTAAKMPLLKPTRLTPNPRTCKAPAKRPTSFVMAPLKPTRLAPKRISLAAHSKNPTKAAMPPTKPTRLATNPATRKAPFSYG